jgi:DNA-binding TFAR19-related protein (PDSD5 family)
MANLNKEDLLPKILSPESYERIARIKMYNKGRGEEIENTLMNLYCSGQINHVLQDCEILEILGRMEAGKKKTKVAFSRRKRDLDLEDVE